MLHTVCYFWARMCLYTCLFISSRSNMLTHILVRFRFNKYVSVYVCVCLCVHPFVCSMHFMCMYAIGNAPYHTPFTLFDMCLVTAQCTCMHVTIDLSLHICIWNQTNCIIYNSSFRPFLSCNTLCILMFKYHIMNLLIHTLLCAWFISTKTDDWSANKMKNIKRW